MNKIRESYRSRNTIQRRVGRRYINIFSDDFCFCLSCNSIHTRLNCQFERLKCIGTKQQHQTHAKFITWIYMHLGYTLNIKHCKRLIIMTKKNHEYSLLRWGTYCKYDEIVIIIGFFIKGVENKSLILVRNF